VDGHGPGAPLDGLARAGWKLVYTDTPTDYIKGADDRNKATDLSYSLGFTVSAEGNVRNVIWDGVGFRAGLAANTSIVAVNNRVFKPELLKAAIKAKRTARSRSSCWSRRAMCCARSRSITTAACATRAWNASRARRTA
jgi:predicted metalloprotease with PDZ domain